MASKYFSHVEKCFNISFVYERLISPYQTFIIWKTKFYSVPFYGDVTHKAHHSHSISFLLYDHHNRPKLWNIPSREPTIQQEKLDWKLCRDKKINLKPCYSKISPSKLSWSAWYVLFTHSHTPARKDSSDWKCRVAGLSFHEKWTDYTNTRWKVRPASHSMHYDISVYLFALPFLFFQTRYVSTSSRFIRNIVKETVVRENTNEENQ